MGSIFVARGVVNFGKNFYRNFDGDYVESWGEFGQHCHSNTIEFSNP